MTQTAPFLKLRYAEREGITIKDFMASGCHFANPIHDPMIRRLSYWQWWVRLGRPDGVIHPGRNPERGTW